jgi:hypothetical protein
MGVLFGIAHAPMQGLEMMNALARNAPETGLVFARQCSSVGIVLVLSLRFWRAYAWRTNDRLPDWSSVVAARRNRRPAQACWLLD